MISFLDKVDMDKTNPEVMGDIWKVISEDIKNENSYKDVKTYFNKKLLNSLPSAGMYQRYIPFYI